jgi:flagellar basal body-associated protein FliL
MADEEKKEPEQNEQKDQAKRDDAATKEKGQVLQWIIMIAVILLLGTVGYFLGSTLGYKPPTVEPGSQQPAQSTQQASQQLLVKDASKTKGWFYDLDPVATNLSDPGSTRYVRAVLTLEMSPEADKESGTKFLDEQKPVIANILNIYFAGLTLDQINSDKDMRRIQYELLEIFNETLYRDSKPLVEQVLFKEFGVQ